MLVALAGLRRLKLTTSLAKNFARKKSKGKYDDDEGDTKGTGMQRSQIQAAQQVKIDQKFQVKSAALYDHYVKSRQRPALTLDNYRIRYVYVIERQPIFLPYNPKKFQYYRTKYQYLKKTGKYSQVPKQLQLQAGDYLFGQYERVNPQNQITHRNIISKTQVYEYAQHSRYWKYTDPTIQDPKSVQTYSSDNVYFIVKNKDGKWQFPTRLVTQRDNHKQIFTLINQQLFAGTPNPLVYFLNNKPAHVNKIQDQSLDRGKGYYDFYFKGFSLNGIPKFPTENYLDYAWVPKPQLSQYFDDDYFKANIKLAIHLC